ncbi:MAG: agmatine deiminase family protein, partial [Ilumatobacteraceae bacterium]
MAGSDSTGFSMPPEWAHHERTWMEFPPANATFGDDADGALSRSRRAWAAVVNAVARFEPVSLICNI